MYPHLFEIAIYFWLGSIGDTIEFQFAFRSKLRGIRFLRRPTNNFDFSVRGTNVSVVPSQPLFDLVTQRAHSPTGNIKRCVTRPNSGCEGGYSKRSTDAFYFCSELFKK